MIFFFLSEKKIISEFSHAAPSFMGLWHVSSPLPSPEGTRKVLFPSRHKYTSNYGLFFMLRCTPLIHQSTHHLPGRKLGVWRCPPALCPGKPSCWSAREGCCRAACVQQVGACLHCCLPVFLPAQPKNHLPAQLETSAAPAAGSWQHWQRKKYQAGVLDGNAYEK